MSADNIHGRFSKKLFLYVGLEFLIPLLYCLAAFWGLFILMDLLDTLDNVLSAELSVLETIVFLFIHEAVNLKFILPMSILLAVSFMMHKFGRHGDTIALRSSGISLISACMPIWLTAFVFAIVTAWTNEQFRDRQAMSTEEALQRHMAAGSTSASDDDVHPTFTYINRQQHRHWFFQKFNKGGDHKGVRVKQFRPDNSIKWEIRAQRVVYRSGAWIFKQGERVQYDPDDLLPTGSPRRFDKYRETNFTEKPKDMMKETRRRPVTMSTMLIFRTLTEGTSIPPAEKATLHAMLAHRLTFPLSCLMAAVLGVGFSLSVERSSAIKGFAMAVGLIILYYVFDQAALTLSRMGYLPGLIGGASPTLIFIIIGITRIIKVR